MLEKMKEIITEQLNLEGVTITEASSFKDDLGADSLDLFELVMALEEEFGVEIPSEDLEKIAPVVTTLTPSSIITFATSSAFGFISITLTPNGLSVNAFAFRISSLTISGGALAAPINPSPPAFDTAAAR